MMFARRTLALLQRVKEINDWYASQTTQIVRVQKYFHLRKRVKELAVKRGTHSKFRVKERPPRLEDAPYDDGEEDSGRPLYSPESNNSHMSSPIGVASRNVHQMSQNDMAALRKWQLRDMHKCFTAWKRYLRYVGCQRFLYALFCFDVY